MTTTPIAPPPTSIAPPLPLSFEDYCASVPPDDQRYELVHGLLTPMATPTGLHTAIIRSLVYCLQRVLAERALSQANTPKRVIVSDLGVRTAIDSSRLPDITVCSQALWSEEVLNPPIFEILQEQDLRDRAAALEREHDRAEAAERQADRLLALLRQHGIDPDVPEG